MALDMTDAQLDAVMAKFLALPMEERMTENTVMALAYFALLSGYRTDQILEAWAADGTNIVALDLAMRKATDVLVESSRANRAQETAFNEVAELQRIAPPVDVKANGSAAPKAKGRKSRLKARSLAELVMLPDPAWLIEGMLPETGTGTLYGPPYGGKTFVMIDIGLHIALGLDYHGVPVKRGPVVHVAAEGSPARIRDRALAWCAARGVPWEDTVGWWSLVDVPVYLDDMNHVKAWLDANRDPDGTFKRSLTIFDTQARNMSGDENSAKDIGKMIQGIDHIRGATEGFAIRLHHEGREVKVGGRGSTAGRGADDVTLHLQVVEKDKRVALITEDLRDGESGQRWVLDLRPQAFMVNGAERHSVAVWPVSHGTVERLLVRLYEERPAQARDLIGDEEGFSKANVYKLLDRAREKGWVEPKPGWWLTDEGIEVARLMGAREPVDVEFEDDEEI